MTVSMARYAKGKVEVNLWSHLFEVIPLTKKTQAKVMDKLDKVERDFEDQALEKHSVQLKLAGARMDIRLRSLGGKRRPSTLMREHWENDELTLPQVDAFWEAVQEAIDDPASDATIAIETYAAAAVPVDLWGAAFEATRVTHTSEPELTKQAKQLEADFAGRDLSDPETSIEVFGRRFDLWLRPEDGEERPASEVVREKWEAEDLTIAQLNAFWRDIQEAVSRP